MAASSASTDFVALPFVIDQQATVDDAIESLRARWSDWEPDEADIEVALIEAIGVMVESVALIAASMGAAALRAFGTKLLGIPYGQGTPSFTTVTLTVKDAAGYTIPAGAEFAIDSFAFHLYADAIVPVGDLSVSAVPVYASGAPTAAANGLTGATIAQLSLPPFVTGVSVEATTADGTDPQTDFDYQNDISREQRTRAKTIVTSRDFEIEALEFSQEIGRATASNDTARAVTVWVATALGGLVSGPTKAALALHFDEFAMVNTVFTISDPTFTTVDVAWHVKMLPLPAVDATDLALRINAMLAERLSPAVFGQPTAGDPTSVSNWIADNTVRLNSVIAWINDTRGVAYVESVLLNGSATDLVLSGAAPLPHPGTMSGVVDP